MCTQIKFYCLNGWPNRTRLQGTVKKYLPVKDELSVTSGLLLRGNRFVIPQSLRPDVLNKLHAGHHGISKCHQWALQLSIWWPAISKDIEDTINRSMVYCTTRFSMLNYCYHLNSLITPDSVWYQIYLNGRNYNTSYWLATTLAILKLSDCLLIHAAMWSPTWKAYLPIVGFQNLQH